MIEKIRIPEVQAISPDWIGYQNSFGEWCFHQSGYSKIMNVRGYKGPLWASGVENRNGVWYWSSEVKNS